MRTAKLNLQLGLLLLVGGDGSAEDRDPVLGGNTGNVAAVRVVLDQQHKGIGDHLDRDQGAHLGDDVLDWLDDLCWREAIYCME